MSDYTIVFALILVISVVAPLGGQDCTKSSVDQCSKAFHVFMENGTLVLGDVLPSWNKSDVHQLCVSYDQYSLCMKTVISHCSLNDKLTQAGLNDAFQYFCTNSSIKEYSAYWECFGRTSLRRSVQFCNETFRTKTRNLHALSNSAEKRSQYCRYYDDYAECVDAAVKPTCGSDASKWQSTFVNKLHQPVLKYIGCSDDSDDDGLSVVTIIVTTFIIIAIILMFVVITVFFIVVRNRHRLAREPRNHQSRRRRHQPATGDPAPDYDAPYVVYGASGRNGQRQLRIVGLDNGESQPVDAANLPAYKGLFIQPPPYDETPPPFSTVDQTPDVARSTDENHELEADNVEDFSASCPDTSRTETDNTNQTEPSSE